MKRFFECAIVKDGNKVVGYFVSELYDMEPKNVLSLSWALLDHAKFFELVKSNQVQYLKSSGDRIICKLTDEEKQRLLNSGETPQSLSEKEKDFWSKETAFSYKHIAQVNGGNALAASADVVSLVFGTPCVALCLYGDFSYRNSVLNSIAAGCNNDIFKYILSASEANNLVTTTVVPLSILKTFVGYGEKYHIMVNTSGLSRLVRDIESGKPKSYNDVNTIKQFIKSFDNMTSRVEDSLRVGK